MTQENLIYTFTGWQSHNADIENFDCCDCGERAAHAIDRGVTDGRRIVWALCEYCIDSCYAADCEAQDVNREVN